MKPRSPAEMEAEASFKLAVWFQQAGNAGARREVLRARADAEPRRLELPPPGVELHAGEAGKKWLEKFKEFDKEYYPKLELKPKGG